jgi:hypothetical protein
VLARLPARAYKDRVVEVLRAVQPPTGSPTNPQPQPEIPRHQRRFET